MERNRVMAALAKGIAIAIVVAGCAARTRVVERETVHQSTDSSSVTTTAPGTATVTTTTPTSTERVETHSTVVHEEPRGFLSSTVHVIGEILALPFRLVGGLLRAIF